MEMKVTNPNKLKQREKKKKKEEWKHKKENEMTGLERKGKE